METGMYLEEKDKFNDIHIKKKNNLYSNKNFWFHSLFNSRWIFMPLLSHSWLSARAMYWSIPKYNLLSLSEMHILKWRVKTQVMLASTGTSQKTGWALPLKWTCVSLQSLFWPKLFARSVTQQQIVLTV